MFRSLRQNKGQGFAVQYAITFFFVVGVLTGMTVYFKRTIQGRIRDATLYSLMTVDNVYNGRMYTQYEPYYTNTTYYRLTDVAEVKTWTGTFNTSIDVFSDAGSESRSAMSGVSNQASPRMGD
ncbi:MAG: hypothetical protein Q8Q08_00355 [Candidatus Omnitrophota bacterium]|nr:hypothetical protein [Candidatus Omnitrophota bacterium]MDZ4241953.1 hypothetical protein [Candidatus Omnitrophota bacterium]